MIQQNSVYIDPKSCGSSIGYYLHIDDYTPKDKKPVYSINSTVVLSDCSHKIDWSFNGDDLDKIDTALQMLHEFRKKFFEAKKLVEKLNK